MGDVNFNDVDAVNEGTIVSGLNNALTVSNEIHWTSTLTSDSTSMSTSDSIIPISTTNSSKTKNAIIISSVIVPCFVIFTLIYCILIRPYLKQRAEKMSRPIDTSRAPMDPAFRQPRKKNYLKE